MRSIITILCSLTIASTLLLSGCTNLTPNQNNTAEQATQTSWVEMVSIIRSGDYQSVGQQHDNTVRLVRNDGTILQAQQPEIDALYQVVNSCAKCQGKPLLSE